MKRPQPPSSLAATSGGFSLHDEPGSPSASAEPCQTSQRGRRDREGPQRRLAPTSKNNRKMAQTEGWLGGEGVGGGNEKLHICIIMRRESPTADREEKERAERREEEGRGGYGNTRLLQRSPKKGILNSADALSAPPEQRWRALLTQQLRNFHQR